MRFGQLEMNPANNPAVLDTGTWNTESAWGVLQSLSDEYWRSIEEAAGRDNPLPLADGFTPFTASFARHNGSLFFLAKLRDGQHVFVEIGATHNPVLGSPVGVKTLKAGGQVAMVATDAPVIDRFFRFVSPDLGPRAMGGLPRLGIGTRMTTAVWPAIFKAMDTCGFAANAIQNSVRELNLLENLLSARPAETNYAFNFGSIETGYTGSTFEGLWVSGVLEALKSPTRPRYGADADHIQVKRGADGVARAKKLVAAARYYTFFTLDVSDILDYQAMTVTSAGASEAYLLDKIWDVDQRKAVLDYHQQTYRVGRHSYRPDPAQIGRLVGKYWDALDAMQELTQYISHLKGDAPFDLELSIDEHPPEIQTSDCLTTEMELFFVLSEMQRRHLPVTHVAPNFGVEKGTDYWCSDGLPGLEKRVQSLLRIADEFGVMLDFHSGDDLSSATRRVIGHAGQGRFHFKISPVLQLLFARVLSDFHPELFLRWWEDALAYARREAEAGSIFAAECVREYEADNKQTPSPHQSIFHHYSFAFVGRRNAQGQFLHREEFYNLSPAFYHEYQTRVVRYLCSLAEDLF